MEKNENSIIENVDQAVVPSSFHRPPLSSSQSSHHHPPSHPSSQSNPQPHRPPRYWGCFTCRSLKNSNKSLYCQYCGTKRLQDRYIIKRERCFYICKIFTDKHFPLVSIVKIFENQKEKFGKIRLNLNGETILESLNLVIDEFDSERISGDNNLHSTNTPTSSQDNTLMTSLLPSHSSSSLLTSSSTSSSSTSKNPPVLEDSSLDLFHRVMKNGENYAYDGNIGQYVHIDTLKDRSHDSHIVRDLQYLKFMKREKYEMNKIVEETLQRRNDEYIENVIDITHDNLKDWKGKVSCSLCEYQFPPSQLLGTISLNTLLKWKLDHNISTNQDSAGTGTGSASGTSSATGGVVKSSSSSSFIGMKYEMMKLCVFCTQFFDENFSSSLDLEMKANEELKNEQKEKLKQKKLKPRETPISKLQIEISIAELYNKKDGSFKKKTLEPLNTKELKRLEEENRHLQYLKAKKKFREYKKRFQDDLEIWKNLQNSPRAESDQQQKIDTESAIPLEAEPQTNSQIRSSTSAGQLQSDQLSSKTENKKDRSRSASSLPQIHKSNTITEKEKLPLVKEQRRERKKEVIGKEIKGKIIQESSRSFLTALDDVLIAEGEEGEEGEDGNKAEPHPEEVPKPIKKKEKPEWVTETDRDRPKRKEAGLDEKKVALKKNEKLAKLVRSAEDCYSQDVEPSVPKKVKTQVKIDTSYTKRRRNRLDPRNNIKKPRKKPVAAAGKKKKMRKKVSSKEAEEAMKMIEETATHAETLELAPQRAVEILEKHQRPNLIVTKRLQIGRRPQKVDAERRNVVEEVEKIVPESRKISSKETSPKDENGNYEDPKGEDGSYEDDAFESDEGDATCTLPPKSFSDGDGDGDVNGDADEDDEYKDDDEFEEDHEQSPVRIALNASAKFNISVLLEENDPNDDPIPVNGSRPSTRRERGGSRSGDPTGGISGIELLSSGQRIGSASNSRRSSRKLPPYENTEPLIIASESEPRPPSRNIHSSHDRKSLVKETNPPAVTTTTTTQLHVVSSPTPQLPTISPSTQSSPSIPAITGIKQHYHHTSTVDDSKKQTSLHLPTNFNLVGDSHRSPALQPSATSSPSEVNVDSKSHQHYMRSDRKTVMRLTPNANLVASDMVGSPTLLDMNIMKQSGQVRRAIKREDSFDKLTRKIARSLANSQTSL